MGCPGCTMLEVSLLGVGTVLDLDKGAWSMVQPLIQATNEYPLPPPSKNVGGVSIRSRSGAPCRKGCATNGQPTIDKEDNK